jgi:hypothetical protein
VKDEDFARAAFQHARETGFAGEPATAYDVSTIGARARRQLRVKQGVYTASTVAFAGVVTAGVVAGPSVLGFGSGSPGVSTVGSGVGTAATTSPATHGASSGPNGKAKVATSCANPPQVDWASVVEQQVPGTDVTLTPKVGTVNGTTCALLPDGSMNIEALFTLSSPKGVVQVDVNTGGTKDGRPSSSATPDPSLLQKKADALKHELAAKSTAASAAGETGDANATESTPVCTTVGAGEQVCSQQVGKGGYIGLTVALTRTTPTPLFVQVIGSSSAPAQPGETPPLTGDQLTRIAEAVASHF